MTCSQQIGLLQMAVAEFEDKGKDKGKTQVEETRQLDRQSDIWTDTHTDKQLKSLASRSDQISAS